MILKIENYAGCNKNVYQMHYYISKHRARSDINAKTLWVKPTMICGGLAFALSIIIILLYKKKTSGQA